MDRGRIGIRKYIFIGRLEYAMYYFYRIEIHILNLPILYFLVHSRLDTYMFYILLFIQTYVHKCL